MPTLGDMKALIADDLARSDLTDQIAKAVANAIARYQNERFAFNEGFVTFQTVAGQAFYGADANPLLPDLYIIDTASLVSGSQTWELMRERASEIELSDTVPLTAMPSSFAYFGRQVRLYPVPDGVYTVRLTAHYKLAAPSSDASSNAWTEDAEDLIVSRAKWRLGLHVLKDSSLVSAMVSAMADALNMLKGKTATMSSTGQVMSYDL